MKFLFSLFTMLASAMFVQAQSDTVYVYRNGVATKIPTNKIDSITFSLAPKITDVAGYSYATVKIGTQTWMAENLRTHLYNDGTPIQKEVNIANFGPAATGVYSWYQTDSISYDGYFGKLYNGFAVTGTKNVCPVGWRVPTNAEVTTLFDYLSTIKFGEEGALIKDDILRIWSPPNMGALNSSGFSAQPSGYFNANTETFSQIYLQAFFWTTTASAFDLWTFGATNTSTAFNRLKITKNSLAPVRCIKE